MILLVILMAMVAFTMSVGIVALRDPGWQPIAMAVILGLPLAALQGRHCLPRPPGGALPKVWPWTLAAHVLLTFLPCLLFGELWSSTPGFLAGSLMLLFPGRFGVPAFALVAGLTPAMMVLLGFPTSAAVAVAVSSVITGLIVFALIRLADAVSQLHVARSELAKAAVAEERLRFARDLHDLLGYSLSAISLKSELTHRLITTHPQRAREEVAEVLTLARDALADVRSVADSYRNMSLSTEMASVRSVLGAAEIDATVALNSGSLPDPVDTLLATVLREGVTNVLRHSKASWCTIEAGRTAESVRLSLVNDGAGEGAGPAGSGMRNLRERVTAMHGTLDAGTRPDGTFRLVAEVPLSF